MGRGTLIVFEGLDRSGKSTQCARLAAHLRGDGRRVEHIRFPDRTTAIGRMIDAYLSGQTQTDDHVVHLLFAANRWEVAGTIDDLIRAGTTVVVDRYYYSGCVYSAAKQVPGMDLAWCRQPEVGLPRPDVCVFLDISAAQAAERGGFGTERYERQDVQDRVRALFGELRQHEDEAGDIVTIDAGQHIEQVEQRVRDAVAAAMERVGGEGTPLRRVRAW